MALEIAKYIDIDFYNNEYILVNAKQYDSNSRVIVATCYNQGKLVNLSDNLHSAYVKFKKADENIVFNSCRINSKGQILVELTEQMLITNGICYVDLVVVNKGDAIVNTSTGNILAIDDSSILTTMAFSVYSYEGVYNNSEIESSYEFDALNDLLQKAEADYSEVILTSKSWAVGGTGIRDGENTNNSKYYSKLSSNSASASSTSATNAANSESNAETYMNNALEYSNAAQESMTNAQTSEANARTSEINALNSEVTAKSYMETTDGYMQTTEGYMNTVNGYMITTQGYMNTTEGYMNTTDGYMDKTEEYMNTTEGYMTTTQGYMSSTEEYMNTTQGYMDTAKSHMDNAETYMNNAQTSESNAKTSETNAATSETNAATSEANASSYMETTNGYMQTTEGYMTTTQGYMDTTEGYMNTTKSHMDAAAVSEANAATSATSSSDSATLAQSYAVGGTNTRDGEDTDNAQYYYTEIKDMFNGLNVVFVPKGTISFSELATVKETAVAGYVYNIKDDFVTDDSFREGSGVAYTAGVNVYYVIDEDGNGMWDCFGGSSQSIATLSEVKEYLGI